MERIPKLRSRINERLRHTRARIAFSTNRVAVMRGLRQRRANAASQAERTGLGLLLRELLADWDFDDRDRRRQWRKRAT